MSVTKHYKQSSRFLRFHKMLYRESIRNCLSECPSRLLKFPINSTRNRQQTYIFQGAFSLTGLPNVLIYLRKGTLKGFISMGHFTGSNSFTRLPNFDHFLVSISSYYPYYHPFHACPISIPMWSIPYAQLFVVMDYTICSS